MYFWGRGSLKCTLLSVKSEEAEGRHRSDRALPLRYSRAASHARASNGQKKLLVEKCKQMLLVMIIISSTRTVQL